MRVRRRGRDIFLNVEGNCRVQGLEVKLGEDWYGLGCLPMSVGDDFEQSFVLRV